MRSVCPFLPRPFQQTSRHPPGALGKKQSKNLTGQDTAMQTVHLTAVVIHSHSKGMQFVLFTLSSSLRQESGSCGLYLLPCCVDPGHKSRLKRRFPEALEGAE